MAKQWQIRRGTTAENNDFTGAIGEVTMDTTTKGLRLHDGSTQGGIEVPTARTADYVVESQFPTSENNYTWYRKYKSGWVEQGQGNHVTSGTTLTIVLPVEMANADYNVSALGTHTITYQNNTTTQFELVVSSGTWIAWQVSGMAA